MPEYILMITYCELKKKLTVDSKISATDLNSRAAELFGLDPGRVALQYHDEDFDEWLVVGSDYKLENKAKLTLVMVNAKGDDRQIDNQAAMVARYKAEITDLTTLAKPKAQGIAFIVGMPDAEGAYEDLISMKRAFDALNFAVIDRFSLHADEIKALCKAIANHKFSRIHHKYIAFYYAGHGGINSNGDSFIQPIQDSQEAERVYIGRDIISVIESQNDRCLLFFFDCCMSNAKDDDDLPSVKVTSTHADNITAFASTFGEKSAGDKKRGGYWTRTLAKNLGKNDRLTNILGDTTAEVKKKYKQNCPYTANLKNPAVNLKASIKCDKDSLLNKSPEEDDFLELLKNYTYQYDDIGRLLGLGYAQRQGIRTNVLLMQDNTLKLAEVYKIWTGGQTSEVTWGHFIAAMKKGNLMKLAGEIDGYLDREDIQDKYAVKPDWAPPPES